MAPALYVCADLVAALRYDGYSWLDQTVSELFAIGAPTRPLVVVLFGIYNLLLVAFGVGVWRAANGRQTLRVTSCLLVASALLGVAVDLFFPIHQRGVSAGLTDTIHAVATAVQVLFIFIMVACTARLFTRAFAWYSLFTIIFLLSGGVLAGLAGGDLAANEPTPWMGATERMLIYAYSLWLAVLSTALLRRPPTGRSPTAN
ncbi:MAG: DUF998 domain-containing protein [Actinobacteria bacterium]|nr:DUF998 domain-containing protein [Actinomycetota bacterium]